MHMKALVQNDCDHGHGWRVVCAHASMVLVLSMVLKCLHFSGILIKCPLFFFFFFYVHYKSVVAVGLWVSTCDLNEMCDASTDCKKMHIKENISARQNNS